MDIEEIINNLNLSKEQIIVGYDRNGTLIKTCSTENSVRGLLNSYVKNKEEEIWLFNTPKRIKNMSDEYILEQIEFLDKRNHQAPYDISWRIIFYDILNKRRLEKLNKIKDKINDTRNI